MARAAPTGSDFGLRDVRRFDGLHILNQEVVQQVAGLVEKIGPVSAVSRLLPCLEARSNELA